MHTPATTTADLAKPPAASTIEGGERARQNLRGRGRMHGRLLGLVTVADGSGPEYDASELVTLLNDAVIFAPSMLLRLPVSWSAASDRSFDVALADRGLSPGDISCNLAPAALQAIA